jgi:hypothetical protein
MTDDDRREVVVAAFDVGRIVEARRDLDRVEARCKRLCNEYLKGQLSIADFLRRIQQEQRFSVMVPYHKEDKEDRPAGSLSGANCPKCGGMGWRLVTGTRIYEDCPACNGSGLRQ